MWAILVDPSYNYNRPEEIARQSIENARQTANDGVAFVQVEAKAGVSLGELGITSSAAFGILLDRQGNIAIYSVPSLGVSNGGGVFTGVSAGLFPKAKNIYEVKEWGIETGFTYSFRGRSFALEGDVALGKNDFRLGGTIATPISLGLGAMGYVDA